MSPLKRKTRLRPRKRPISLNSPDIVEAGLVLSKADIQRLRIKRKKRTAAEFLRVYGGQARVDWMKAQPCIVQAGDCAGPIDVAHTKVGGMSRKADAKWTVPLCRRHHRALHSVGRETFELTYSVNLDAAAAETERQWQEVA